MPKQPKLTAREAENLLFDNGFILIRTQESHRIYGKDSIRVVVPFHSNKTLHPKIIKQVIQAIDDS